jgi:hypothetical protein
VAKRILVTGGTGALERPVVERPAQGYATGESKARPAPWTR